MVGGTAPKARHRHLLAKPRPLCFALEFLRFLLVMPGNPDPDADLMLRVKQGDMAAFEELVEKYKQPVLNLLYRTLPDATEAEDLAQNVFLQVYKSAHRYRVSAKFSTWLFTIARNLCLNEIRRRSRHPAESLELAHPEYEDQPLRQHPDKRTFSPPDQLLQDELAEKVAEALDALPENQRTAILLFREEEMSYEEISQVLGCSLSATKSLIHRGRETLKQKLKPYLKTGAWGESRK
jgi:RNA polymerase sigma-70 factor, ECF subfamily